MGDKKVDALKALQDKEFYDKLLKKKKKRVAKVKDKIDSGEFEQERQDTHNKIWDDLDDEGKEELAAADKERRIKEAKKKGWIK
jgi:Fe2+ transport system protein B